MRAVSVVSGIESDELIVSTQPMGRCSVSGALCNVDADCTSPQTCNPAGSPAPLWWGDAIGALQYFCNADINQPACDPLNPEAACGTDPCSRAWTLPNGSVNFDDVNAALTLVAPPGVGVPAEMTWVDLHGGAGDGPPNGIMNSSDLQQFIFGFSGFPYTGYDPADCPDVGVWP